MALAGHSVAVYWKATSGSYSGGEVDGIKSVGYSPSLDLLDVTDFKDTTGAKLKLAGLKDGSIKLSGNLEMADVPQALIRTNAGDGVSGYATVIFAPSASTGSKGFQVECKVASFDISASPDGTVDFSCDLQFTGAPAVDA